jgi:hypothetical protein
MSNKAVMGLKERWYRMLLELYMLKQGKICANGEEKHGKKR